MRKGPTHAKHACRAQLFKPPRRPCATTTPKSQPWRCLKDDAPPKLIERRKMRTCSGSAAHVAEGAGAQAAAGSARLEAGLGGPAGIAAAPDEVKPDPKQRSVLAFFSAAARKSGKQK